MGIREGEDQVVMIRMIAAVVMMMPAVIIVWIFQTVVAVKSVKPYAGKEVLKVGCSEEEKRLTFFLSFFNMHQYASKGGTVTISVLFSPNSRHLRPISFPFLLLNIGRGLGK